MSSPSRSKSVIIFSCFLSHGVFEFCFAHWTLVVNTIFVNKFEIILREFSSRQELILSLSNPVASAEPKAFQAPSKRMGQCGPQSQPVYFTANPRPNNLVRSVVSIFLGGKLCSLPNHSLPPENFWREEKAIFWRPFLPLELVMFHRESSPRCHLEGWSQTAPI